MHFEPLTRIYWARCTKLEALKITYICLLFRFLSKEGVHIPRVKLQLVGVTAMLLASKVCINLNILDLQIKKT